ncbi:hypothetical protein ACFYXH_06770 [Streptomyces sp. NPDC002730]|uniref:hypothetical protein n=1 Tax=Streptomyces sp. NPDC002730 TaxID=3364662 RepID=UPI0036BC6A91
MTARSYILGRPGSGTAVSVAISGANTHHSQALELLVRGIPPTGSLDGAGVEVLAPTLAYDSAVMFMAV